MARKEKSLNKKNKEDRKIKAAYKIQKKSFLIDKLQSI